MTKVVIDMSMSLDGFVAGPDDSRADPLGGHGGMHLFDWYFSGDEEYCDPLLRPETGANRDEVERMFAESGAFIFGRRTCEIAHGWGGRHPVNGVPVFVLTDDPPADYPADPRTSRSSRTASRAPTPGPRSLNHVIGGFMLPRAGCDRNDNVSRSVVPRLIPVKEREMMGNDG
jgi:hypothetical protein